MKSCLCNCRCVGHSWEHLPFAFKSSLASWTMGAHWSMCGKNNWEKILEMPVGSGTQSRIKIRWKYKKVQKNCLYCLKKSFQHPVENGKITINGQQAWHNQVLREVIKKSSRQPKENLCLKGAEHMIDRKISTFPFCKDQFTFLSISYWENVKCMFKYLIWPFWIHQHFFSTCYFHIKLNIATFPFHLQLLLHAFSISCVWKPTLLYYLFYISVLLHWDCVEIWLYRVDSITSSVECSWAVSYSLTKLSWKVNGRIWHTVL